MAKRESKRKSKSSFEQEEYNGLDYLRYNGFKEVDNSYGMADICFKPDGSQIPSSGAWSRMCSNAEHFSRSSKFSIKNINSRVAGNCETFTERCRLQPSGHMDNLPEALQTLEQTLRWNTNVNSHLNQNILELIRLLGSNEKENQDDTLQASPNIEEEKDSIIQDEHPPWKEWLTHTLDDLSEEERGLYYESLELAKGNAVLAHFLYKNCSLSLNTKMKYAQTFFKLTSRHGKFDLDSIKRNLIFIDSNNQETKEHIQRKWNMMLQIAECCYGYNKQAANKVIFSSTKTGNSSEKSASKSKIMKAYNECVTKKRYKEACLIDLMWNLRLRPTEVKYLKFDDIICEDNEYYINVYRTVSKVTQTLIIPEESLSIINLYKKQLKESGGYKTLNRKGPNMKPVKGYYMFGGGANYVNQIFRSGFNGTLTKFDYNPSQFRKRSKVRFKFKCDDSFKLDNSNRENDNT